MEQPSAQIWTVPNLISFGRLLLVPVFAFLIVAEHDYWALAVLAVSGVTDFLDGWLARRWNQVSDLGAKLDPAADRLYILSTLLGLAYRDFIPWWLVGAVVARDVVLSGMIPFLKRLGLEALPVHYLGKAATFNLLYAFPLILLGEGEQHAGRRRAAPRLGVRAGGASPSTGGRAPCTSSSCAGCCARSPVSCRWRRDRRSPWWRGGRLTPR